MTAIAGEDHPVNRATRRRPRRRDRAARRRSPRPSPSRSSRPRRSRGVPATSQERPPVQERALPTPWAKRATPSARAEPAKPKAMLATAMSDEPAEHGTARAEARGRQAARERADERACGVRADEETRLALREPELVRVVRQERRQGRVQHRVREHDRADEEEQTAHAAMLASRSMRREFSAGGVVVRRLRGGLAPRRDPAGRKGRLGAAEGPHRAGREARPTRPHAR